MHIYDEVTARTAKAGVAFSRLRAKAGSGMVSDDTKLMKVYKAVVLPTLFYACETWKVYQRHAKKRNDFHLSCLRKLLKIKLDGKNPRYRGPEEGKDAKRTYSIKACTASLTLFFSLFCQP